MISFRMVQPDAAEPDINIHKDSFNLSEMLISPARLEEKKNVSRIVLQIRGRFIEESNWELSRVDSSTHSDVIRKMSVISPARES
jgi:hypothetical protein